MRKNLTIQQELLAKVMSDVSGRCYCAGWMENLEYILWHAVNNGERSYGMDTITQRDIDTLKWLSNEFDGWIFFDDEHSETAISVF